MPDEPTHRKPPNMMRLLEIQNDNIEEHDRVGSKVHNVEPHHDLIERVDAGRTFDEMLFSVRTMSKPQRRAYLALEYAVVADRDGNVTVARERGGMTVEEVAAHYKWTVETCERYLRQARGILREDADDRQMKGVPSEMRRLVD